MSTETSRYTATAQRDGTWWAVSIYVPELDRILHTQVRRLDQAEEMVADLIATVTGVEESSYLGRIDIEPVLNEKVRQEINFARQLRNELEERLTRVTAANQAAARDLAAMELSQRDIGVILGLTHQRVSQLLSEKQPTRHRSAKVAATPATM
jgi:predicted membrane GTPase involved in stress response